MASTRARTSEAVLNSHFLGLFRQGLLPWAYVSVLVVMFVLPLFSVPEYSILKNTTSHLGAQHAPHAWVMNVVFALLGIASVADGWPRLRGYWLHRAALALFGLSLVLTATFQHAPIVDGVPFSAVADDLHSKMATVTGFSFIVLAVAAAFIETPSHRRWLAAGTATLATGCSWLIFNVPDLAGVWQRILFLTTFAWLMYFLYPRRKTV
jgi:hypothetical membrane protein